MITVMRATGPTGGATARRLADVFVEAVIAPGYDAEAKKALAGRKNLRVMDMDTTSIHRVTGFDMRRVMGGLLVQEGDLPRLDRNRCECRATGVCRANGVGERRGLDGLREKA